MLKVAVLISGGGSNLQSIIDYNTETFKVEMVIGSKEGIYGLERAEKAGIKTHIVSKKDYGDNTSDKILELTKDKVDLIVLAGYLSILEGELLKVFKDKIINIHPSLIPSFCGPKMYGMNVHNAVRDSGVKFTGCTVHYVNEEVDGGAIILQEIVEIGFDESAEDIQKNVLKKEHIILPKAIELISKNKIVKVDNRVKIV